MITNLFLLLFVLCLLFFFLTVYFQLVKMETSLKKHLEQIEYYLVDIYGEEQDEEDDEDNEVENDERSEDES